MHKHVAICNWIFAYILLTFPVKICGIEVKIKTNTPNNEFKNMSKIQVKIGMKCDQFLYGLLSIFYLHLPLVINVEMHT